MKKPLLLGMSLMLGITLSAQGKFRKMPSNATAKKAKTFVTSEVSPADLMTPANKDLQPKSNNAAKITAPPYKKISGSYNLLTALVSQSNCLNYNKELNAVSFVHRQSPNFGNSNANSGNTQITYSANWGATWDSLVFGICNGSSIRYRYPSGAIFNPSGNTNIANAFAVGSGPITDGSGWAGNYYVSGQLNNTNLDAQDMINGAGSWPTHHFARIDFDIVNQNAKVSSSLLADVTATTAAAYGYRGMSIATGTFNTGTNTFDWTFDSIKPKVKYDPSDNSRYLLSQGYQAWSNNGQIGYYVFIGIDSNATTPETRAYQPIVYKTTNGGTTWAQYQPLFDWLTAVPNQYLYSYDGFNVKPFFSTSNGNDMAVDSMGELHMAFQITSGYDDDDDSLAYTIGNIPNYIYDIYTDAAAGYKVELIDSIDANASNGEATTLWTDGTDPYDNDARLQMSISEDRGEIFFVWVDSDISGLADPINVAPEIMARGVKVNGRCWTDVKKISASSDYAWYHYVSQHAKGASGSYSIPVTYVNSADASYNAINPVNHYFVDDLTFTDVDFSMCPVGFADNAALISGVSVYPNPATNKATLAIKMKESSEIKVNIYNMMGQLVFNQKLNGEAGLNKITVSAENMASGIYFYEVKAGDYTVSDKIMIQK